MTIDRRNMMRAAATTGIGAIAAAAAPGGDARAHDRAEKSPIVLVHGAWHGGWCWSEVTPILRASGHAVYAPSLTGLGDRKHLLSRSIDLDTHADDIANLIAFEQLSGVTLVGHSYAGHVIPLVADRIKERIARLIYLDAVLPVAGQAFVPEAMQEERLAQFGEDYVLPHYGLGFLDIPDDHPRAADVLERLVPHPLGTLMQPVVYANGGPDGLPQTFIRCTERAPYDAARDREMTSGPGWDYRTIATGHDAMITAPDETARMILDIVATSPQSMS